MMTFNLLFSDDKGGTEIIHGVDAGDAVDIPVGSTKVAIYLPTRPMQAMTVMNDGRTVIPGM